MLTWQVTNGKPQNQNLERDGEDDFDLFDLVEMFFDWKAATERHDDGDIYRSIKINEERFEMSEQLCSIYKNTAKRLGW